MELDQLLHELAVEPPCGEDMSFSPEFDDIQELRRADDPTIAQGEWVTTLKTADWPGVVAATGKILAERSKDLRVAGWWTEARAHQQGYAGLADGLQLARELCARYWDSVHPRLEDGDAELRVGSLSRLLSQVSALANSLPVLQRGDLSLSLTEVDAARNRQAGTDPHTDPNTPAKPNADTVAKALRETPASRIAQQRDDSLRAQAELAQLQQVVDAHLGIDGPGFTAARRALEQAVHGMERLAREAGVGGGDAAGTTAPNVVATTDGPVAGAGTGGSLGGGVPATRAQALAQLRVVADFFRRTEPHSPVAYLADKAARWGDMPLHVWLRAVMKDPGSLTQLEEMLGVEPPAGEHNG
jgi:type VI secretion system protein ImpA